MRKDLKPRRSRLRFVKPGATYLITKKTNDDLFLLQATAEINAILLYALILKANRYGILIHGLCFMSNHFHLVVTDCHGQLPAFMGEFLSDTSKAMQVHLRQNRRIWSGTRYSAVALLDLDAAERKTAYTVLNPSRARLTDPADWPGLTSFCWSFGDLIVAKRPRGYFSPRYRPNEVSCVLEPLPPVFCETGEKEQVRATANEESAIRIHNLVEVELESIRKDLDEHGASFAGPERVSKLSREKRASHPVRHLVPRFATKDPGLLAAMTAEWKMFEVMHERARRRYVSGHRGVVFPLGTYGYSRMLGVRVAKESVAA